MGFGIRRQRERSAEVRYRSSVYQPAERSAPDSVGSFQPVDERVSEAHPTEYPPDGLFADVDVVILDEDEREGSGVELRFEERLYWLGVPAGGHEFVRPTGRRLDGRAEQRVATVVDEKRLFTCPLGASGI